MQNYLRIGKIVSMPKQIIRKFGDYENFAGYQNTAMRNVKYPGITLVRDKATAKRVIDVLYKYKDR